MTYTHLQKVRILYKTILRLHRGLPRELFELGTQYVKDEFKRHKKCNPQEAHIFMNEWTVYALTLVKQLGLKGPQTASDKLGINISPEDLDKFNDSQICQLYELMKAATCEQDPHQR